jgi:hypothetical protein
MDGKHSDACFRRTTTTQSVSQSEAGFDSTISATSAKTFSSDRTATGPSRTRFTMLIIMTYYRYSIRKPVQHSFNITYPVWPGSTRHSAKHAGCQPFKHPHTRHSGQFSVLCNPWSRVRIEKLIGSQLLKPFPALYGTRSFINPHPTS